MKIPEKIKIGGKTYTVEITNKMDLGINNVSAEILYGDLIIRVSPQAAAKMEADFIHEIVHAIYFGLGYRDHDEKRVDELANALHSVIVDGTASNPVCRLPAIPSKPVSRMLGAPSNLAPQARGTVSRAGCLRLGTASRPQHRPLGQT